MAGLAAGICEVAFVKHTTPADFVQETEGQSVNDYRYLCLAGGCEPVADS